jgi:hypothetical protein
VVEALRGLRSAGCQHTADLDAKMASLSRKYRRRNEYFAPYLTIPTPDGRTRARFKELMKQLNFEFWDEFTFQIQRSPYVRGLWPSWVPN